MSTGAETQSQEGVSQKEQLPQISRSELAFLATGIDMRMQSFQNHGFDLPATDSIATLSASLTQIDAEKLRQNGPKNIHEARLAIIKKVRLITGQPNADEIIQELALVHPDQAEFIAFLKSTPTRKDKETQQILTTPAIDMYEQQVQADLEAARRRSGNSRR
jgi:hypothetical protein